MAMTYQIREAQSDEEILSCWETIKGLRPHLKQDDFLPQVRVQQTEGYHLLYIRDPETDKVQSIIAYREFTMLYTGRCVYIEDLATVPEGRGKGYAGALITRVINHAKEGGFKSLGVDSHNTRHTAHRLYLNKGFEITCHHFEYPNLQGK